MRLYILRHADADTPAPSDDARTLSEKGLTQARKVARFFESHELPLSLVLASPVRRAHETALLVSAHLRTELVIAPWLACGMRPETALAEMPAHEVKSGVMLVGHEPDLSGLLSHLLGAEHGGRFHVRKASLAMLEIPSWRRGAAQLHFLIPCRLM